MVFFLEGGACPPYQFVVSRARRFVWGRQINRLVTVAHIPGPLPECWQSQSDRFADSVTKQTLIIQILSVIKN